MNTAPPGIGRAAPRLSAAGMRAPSHHVSRTRLSLLLVGLGAALVGSVLLATGLGPVSVPVSDTGRIVLRHLIPGAVSAPADKINDQIVWQFRLPRALLGAVIGAGLALVGCALQATVRNPLADPYLLGVSSGASLGAVLVLVVGSAAVGGLSLSAAAFVGALGVMGVVYVLAQRGGRVTPFRLVLAGVALAYLFQALYGVLLLKADPYDVQGILFWLFGSLGGARWPQLGCPPPPSYSGAPTCSRRPGR